MKRYKMMLIFLLFVTNALVGGTHAEHRIPVIKDGSEEKSGNKIHNDFIFFMSYLYQ